MPIIPRLKLKDVLRRGPGERQLALRQANSSRDDGNFELAAQQYEAVLARWGEDFGILVQWGNMLKDSGAFAEAEAAYGKALVLRPDDADCNLQLGHLMKMAGNPGRAREFYEEAVRLDTAHPHAAAELRELEAAARRDRRDAESGAPAFAAVAPSARAILLRSRMMGNQSWRRG